MKYKPIPCSSERAQSLMELAMIVLLLIIIVVGIIDIGRMLFYNISLRDAAEEGVIYGSLEPSATTAIENRVKSSLAQYGADGVEININMMHGGSSISPGQACSGDQIQVIVTQPHFRLTVPILGSFLGTEDIKLSNDYKGTVLKPDCP